MAELTADPKALQPPLNTAGKMIARIRLPSEATGQEVKYQVMPSQASTQTSSQADDDNVEELRDSSDDSKEELWEDLGRVDDSYQAADNPRQAGSSASGRGASSRRGLRRPARQATQSNISKGVSRRRVRARNELWSLVLFVEMKTVSADDVAQRLR